MLLSSYFTPFSLSNMELNCMFYTSQFIQHTSQFMFYTSQSIQNTIKLYFLNVNIYQHKI